MMATATLIASQKVRLENWYRAKNPWMVRRWIKLTSRHTMIVA